MSFLFVNQNDNFYIYFLFRLKLEMKCILISKEILRIVFLIFLLQNNYLMANQNHISRMLFNKYDIITFEKIQYLKYCKNNMTYFIHHRNLILNQSSIHDISNWFYLLHIHCYQGNSFVKKENIKIYHDLPTLGHNQNEQVNHDIDVYNMIKPLIHKDWNNINREKIKSEAKFYIENTARNQLLNPFQQNVKTFFDHFGQTEINLSVDNKGRFNQSRFLLLTPWYKNNSHVLFSQLGFQSEERTIGHIGIGQRFDDLHPFLNLGYNVFIDYDLDQQHKRMSIGTEAASNYFKLSTNYYWPITKWRDSFDMEDYMERPAEGFDIRLQGYLPNYPQLGGKMKYEQYFGKEVALFNKTKRQKNPKAVSIGIDYRPFPLASIYVDHKLGQNHHRETKLGLTLNYQFGTPLSSQLDPNNLNEARNLKQNRLAPVDRNYNIVMEYKEKQLLSVDLPAMDKNILEGDIYVIRPLIKNKYPIKTVSWLGDVSQLSLSSSSADKNSPVGWKIILPEWNSEKDAKNTYRLAIQIEDTKGHQAISNYMDIVVRHERKIALSVADSREDSINQGEIQLKLEVKDHHEKTMKEKDMTPEWTILDPNNNKIPLLERENCSEDTESCIRVLSTEKKATGEHVLTLSSDMSGTFEISASIKNYGQSNIVDVIFNKNPIGRRLLMNGPKPQNIYRGIFLLEDNPHPGSGAQDYTKPGAPHPKVGKTYLFRAWIDENNDGIWDKNEPEAMDKITRIQWKLEPVNPQKSFNSEELIIKGATTDQYTIPIKNDSEPIKSHQGFRLMVESNDIYS
ncbi:hypothetical protein BJP44_07940 [Candidatus Williamhamiltonella defendens]|nr:hypothetical protein BJP44_07940 [Candidatus Hamiltonella defensa]